MSVKTAIEWCDMTFNPWQGCVKVSPACTNCYAAALGKRFGVEWGPKARRKFQSESYWTQPLKWNAQAEREGVRARVFCASMADVFELLPDGHPDQDAMGAERYRLYALIAATPQLDWLLLTKRPENVLGMVPGSWVSYGFPANVWVGATAENQEQADRRIPELLRIPAAVRFLSCEPLLGPLDLSRWIELVRRAGMWQPADAWTEHNRARAEKAVHWVITGGESGPGARPSHPDWFRSLRDQCGAAGVPFFFKQWGDWLPYEPEAQAPYWRTQDGRSLDGHVFLPDWDDPATEKRWDDGLAYVGQESHVIFERVGKKAAGRTLDGRTWDQSPEVARA